MQIINTYFSHKVVWITGASQGIGKQLAIEISKFSNVKLILSGRSQPHLLETQIECNKNNTHCEILPFDLENTNILESISKKAISLFGYIDILIHNAGIGQRGTAVATNNSVFRKIMDTNFTNPIILNQYILSHMLSRKIGHIAVISSISGHIGFPNRSAYCASKHALKGYFESVDFETRKQGVPITIISPGRIQTKFSKWALTENGEHFNSIDTAHTHGVLVTTCCKKIIKGISKKKRIIYIGTKEQILLFFYKYCSPLFYWIIKRIKSF